MTIYSLGEILKASGSVHARFADLVRERALQTDTIAHITVIALSASWTARLWRNEGTGRNQVLEGSDNDGVLTRRRRLTSELQILHHTLILFQILLDVGRLECNDAVAAARSGDPFIANPRHSSKALTAIFRRMLPALRIMTKWMKSHIDYIQRSVEKAVQAEDEMLRLLKGMALSEGEQQEILEQRNADELLIDTVPAFWRSYADFINTLRFAFPYDSLPALVSESSPFGAPPLCLEEDLDMRGFTPVKKAMTPFVNAGKGDLGLPVKQSQAHPNEEQLMRIADLLIDAKVVAESSSSAIVYDDTQSAFFFADDHKGLEVPTTSSAPKLHLDVEDDGEQILIPREALQQPRIYPADAKSMIAPNSLLRELDAPRNEAIAITGGSSVPQSHMLFGGIGQWQPTNIWSAGPNDAQALAAPSVRRLWQSDTMPASTPLPPPGHPAANALEKAFAAPNANGGREGSRSHLNSSSGA